MGRRLKTYGLSTPGTTQIATTGNTDEYVIVPKSGTVKAALFSALAALAQHATDIITFTITNLGQAGAGTAAILGAVDGNTTKTTTGQAIAANTKNSLVLTTTTADLAVVEGDRLRIRFAATNTLANAVTRPVVTLLIDANGQ